MLLQVDVAAVWLLHGTMHKSYRVRRQNQGKPGHHMLAEHVHNAFGCVAVASCDVLMFLGFGSSGLALQQ